MKFKGLLSRFALMGLLTCTALTSSAGLLENMQKGLGDIVDFVTPYRGPKKDIVTLIITSNYVKSKMLAELIQFDTKQPYILLPAAGQDKIFFCPAHGRKPQEIKEDKLARFIKFVNPRQILVLGDKTYVQENYLKMIDEHQTLWVVSNRNWNQTALSVGKLLNLSNLADDFKRTLDDWQSGQRYTPVRSQIPLQQMQAEEAPVVEQDTTPVALEPEPQIALPAIEEEVIEEPTLLAEPEIIIPEAEPVIIEEK